MVQKKKQPKWYKLEGNYLSITLDMERRHLIIESTDNCVDTLVSEDENIIELMNLMEGAKWYWNHHEDLLNGKVS